MEAIKIKDGLFMIGGYFVESVFGDWAVYDQFPYDAKSYITLTKSFGDAKSYVKFVSGDIY